MLVRVWNNGTTRNVCLMRIKDGLISGAWISKMGFMSLRFHCLWGQPLSSALKENALHNSLKLNAVSFRVMPVHIKGWSYILDDSR